MERLTDKELVQKLKDGYYGDLDKWQEAYIHLAELEDKLESRELDNVKEAIKEFAEELKNIFRTKHAAVIANVVCNRIDELYNERYGGYDCETCQNNNNAK